MLYRQSSNRSDRSVQLTNRRLRACRGENYFKSKGSEISLGHERPLCHVKRYFLMLVHTHGHKETGNWCVLVKPLRQRKHASVWCMTQKAIVTGCSHLLELRLATSCLFLLSFFYFSLSLFYPLLSSDRDLRPILFVQSILAIRCQSGGRTAVNISLTIAYFIRW